MYYYSELYKFKTGLFCFFAFIEVNSKADKNPPLMRRGDRVSGGRRDKSAPKYRLSLHCVGV